ncbi:MAG: TIGR01777 family oxidoreductase [Candidatus Eremiobacteraeota bacterium]|nr:TIGR01777 family oxidoreductase [Candidatus Eremiobacteraeota bacterium]
MTAIAVTGANGFVGSALVKEILARGHVPLALGRNPDRMKFDERVERRRFDPEQPRPNPSAFEGADAVIHLAGETVAGRWTTEKKRRIYASRIEGTRVLVESLAALERRPAVLASASASGYYGSRGDATLTEESPPGNDFLARVCLDWEREAATAERLGIRVVRLRTGIALGNGGALAKMRTPFALGLGGPFGKGRQFVPWIHLADLASLYLFAVDREDVRGPLNAVAPDAATNIRFARAFGAALHRPAMLPVPRLPLRLLLGEFTETLFASQRLVPAVAERTKFVWRYPHLEEALAAIVGTPSGAR